MINVTENELNTLMMNLFNRSKSFNNLVDVQEYINNEISKCKNLSLSGVGCRFFTKADIQKDFEIITNSSGHGFNIGEIVTLLELNADPDDDEYKFRNKDTYWYCNFAEVKRL